MTDPATESDQPSRGFRWPKKTIILLLVIGGLVLATPYAISYAIKTALVAAGAENAHVDKVHFNPWTGNLIVERLAIEVADLPTVVVKEAGVDLDWSELLHRRIVIENIHITDTDVRIKRNADGSINVIGLEVLPAAGESDTGESGSTTASAPGADSPAAADNSTPIIQGAGVTLFSLRDISLSYEDPQLQTTLVIEQLTVTRVHSWDADHAATLSFTGTLNGAAITIEAEILAFSDDRSVKAKVTIDGLDLNSFEKVASPALGALAGILGIDTEINLELAGDTLGLHQNGTITLATISVAFPGGKVDEESVQWNGSVALDLDLGDDATGPVIEIEGKLDGSKAVASLPKAGIDVNSQSLVWEGKVSLGAEGVDTLQVTGDATLGQTAFKMTGAVAIETELEQLTVTDLTLKGTDHITVGAAKLRGVTTKLAGAVPVDAKVGELAVSSVSVAGVDKISVADVKASGLEVEVAGAAPVSAKLGGLEVSKLSVQGGDQVAADSIGLTEVSATLPGDKPMDASVTDLRVTGLQLKGSEAISAAGIAVNGTRLTDQATGIALGEIGSLMVDQLTMAGTDSIEIASVKAGDIRGLAAKSGDDQVFTAKALTVTTIAVRKLNDLQFASIELSDSNTTVTRLKNGGFYLLDDITGGSAASPAATATPSAPDQSAADADANTAPAAPAAPLPIRVRIADLHTTGENALHYSDAGVTPKHDVNVIIDTLSVKNIDTGAPDQPNQFEFAARVGKYGKISSKGDLRPIARPPAADLTLTVDALDLKVISPFLLRALGYIVESGAMDVKTTFKVDPKGEMSGENKIKITQLVLKQGDKKVIEEMASGSSMPLDMALDLLRDDNNIIELDIPISGNVNDPNIDFSNVIGTVIGKAAAAGAKTVALTYLQTALFPYGTLLTLAEMGVKQMGKISLDPIIYTVGSSEPPDTAAEYLEKVSGILKKDEKFNLRLCPFYTLEDAQAVAAQPGAGAKTRTQGGKRSPLSTHGDETIALSRARGEALKDRMIKEFQVPAKRILVCEPDIDDSGTGKPRVDLLL